MTVKEYAMDVNLSVAEILKKCNDLGIEVGSADDVLSDEEIIKEWAKQISDYTGYENKI